MPDCRHRWRIATPHGTPSVWGRYRKCKLVRRFPAGATTRLSFGDASRLASVVREGQRG